MDYDIQKIYIPDARFLESPLYVKEDSALYFVDLELKRVYRFNLITQKIDFEEFSRVPSKIFKMEKNFILALDNGLYLYEYQHRLNLIMEFPFTKQWGRLNDGIVLDNDTILIGTITNHRLAEGFLYQCNLKDKTYTIIQDDVTNSNGMAVYKDRLYYIDSYKYNIQVYSFKEKQWGKPIYYFNPEELGKGDGMIFDDPYLLVCLFGLGRIDRININTNQLEESIHLDINKITSLVIIDKNIWVTTAQETKLDACLYKIQKGLQ